MMEDPAATQEKHIPAGEQLQEMVQRTCPIAHCWGKKDLSVGSRPSV